MTTWTVLTVLADGLVAAFFLAFGFRRRRWKLMGGGVALVVAIAILVGATIRHNDNLKSEGFLLGPAASTVGFLGLAIRQKPANRRP
jgi:hypothetical protein